MNCWVVLYTHRSGVATWPVFQVTCPTKDSITKKLVNWEPEKGESIEIRGPFDLPSPTGNRMGEAYAKGWDSHEGSLLGILGIQDLECQGIDAIVKDLVRRCPGFKEWRKRFKRGSLEEHKTLQRARRKKL